MSKLLIKPLVDYYYNVDNYRTSEITVQLVVFTFPCMQPDEKLTGTDYDIFSQETLHTTGRVTGRNQRLSKITGQEAETLKTGHGSYH